MLHCRERRRSNNPPARYNNSVPFRVATTIGNSVQVLDLYTFAFSGVAARVRGIAGRGKLRLCQVANQIQQQCSVYGLAQVIVAPTFKTAMHISLHGIGRQCHNWLDESQIA